MAEKIVMKPITELKPYRNNPRKISAEAVNAVAESIRKYGFHGAIQIESDGTIINGHTRLKAAKKLGMKALPCEIVDDLEAEKIRQYRLIDNKSAEYSRWDPQLLSFELSNMDFGEMEFDFDFSKDLKQQKEWQEIKKLCDLKDRISTRRAVDTLYSSLFKVGKNGKPLEELKTEQYVPMFASTAVDFLRDSMGGNFCECDWCLITTPRRRHATGFHFATAVCRMIAQELRIPFYDKAVISLNKRRLAPEFEIKVHPKQRNIILYDDIITTGVTINTVRNLMIRCGYTVFTVISIDNH